MKKWQIFLTWFLYACAISCAYDLTRWLIENNSIGRRYTTLIGLIYLFLGWLGARIEIKITKSKKRK